MSAAVAVPAETKESATAASTIFFMEVPNTAQCITATYSDLTALPVPLLQQPRTIDWWERRRVSNPARGESHGRSGDPGRIRTCNPQSRNLMLYPVELRDR